MRKEFGKFMVEVAEQDEDVYLIVGDIGYGIYDEFIKKFPDRFINIGICEQSMISIASGMALMGLKPYVYTITPFLIERPYEQVKIDVDLNNVNVKLVGYADYPTQGPTHKCVNEHMLDCFENIKCYYPGNSEETKNCLRISYWNEKPTFISLKKDKGVKK